MTAPFRVQLQAGKQPAAKPPSRKSGSRGERHDPSASSISAMDGGCGCNPGGVALRFRANLSVAAGAPDCAISARRWGQISARLVGQWLSERLGQPFVIENRPGAGTNIIPRRSRVPSDGHTPVGQCGERDQRDALRQAQVSTSSATSHRLAASSACRASCWSIRRFRPNNPAFIAYASQSSQAKHGVGRHRQRVPPRRRVVQDDGRHRHGSCLSWHCPGTHRLLGGQDSGQGRSTAASIEYVRPGSCARWR